jgi:hypothetical protein
VTADELLDAAQRGKEPIHLGPLARALFLAAGGDWEGAHRIAQDEDGSDAAWVHAHLHRQEGDLGNARYWYGRAGKPTATDSLADEWRRIASAILPSE